jgi:hypothetical protein
MIRHRSSVALTKKTATVRGLFATVRGLFATVLAPRQSPRRIAAGIPPRNGDAKVSARGNDAPAPLFCRREGCREKDMAGHYWAGHFWAGRC